MNQPHSPAAGQDPRGEDTNGPTDPALSPTDIVSAKAKYFIEDICNQTLNELGQLRDQIDEAMRAIRARQEKAYETILEFAEDTNAAIAMKDVVSDAMAHLQSRLAKSPPPAAGAVPPTVTQHPPSVPQALAARRPPPFPPRAVR